MTAPIAGWYADPAGDTSKLRYWDGTKWTDSCMEAAAAQTPPTSQPAQPQPAATGQFAGQAAPTAQPIYPSAAAQPVGQPVPPVQVDCSQTYVNYADMPLYYVSPQDSTLRLIAFILALLSTITAGWFIIPLAWMIPMTVMTWGVYKGKRPNTVAFGVCSLIFLNVVGGILLLVSTKDE